MYKPNERDKEIFRQRIIKGAQLFDKYLLHKEFIIITIDFEIYKVTFKKKEFIIITIDFEIYKVTFKKKEFLHLTGLTVNVGENLFYDLCKTSKISKNNINNFQRHNKNTLMTKTENINKLIKFIYADASTNLILKDFIMSSAPNRPFPCAIENSKENMVLAFAKTNNLGLKAKSLRKKTNNEIFASSHLILAIFLKEENDALANSIVYIKNTRNLLECPNINEYVSIKILNKFIELK